MHWLLVVSAVLMAWLATGWITMNVALSLFRRGLFPVSGPYVRVILACFVLADEALDVLFSSGHKRNQRADMAERLKEENAN